MVTDFIMCFSSLFFIAGVTYKFDNSKLSWMVTHAADNEELDNPDNENKDDNVIKKDTSSRAYGNEGDNPTYSDATDGMALCISRTEIKMLGFLREKCQLHGLPKNVNVGIFIHFVVAYV
jgi:hypothetical protein